MTETGNKAAKGWLTAFAAMAALFALPVFLIGYPVLANQEHLMWMLYVGLLLCAPAMLGYLWFCIGPRRKQRPAAAATPKLDPQAETVAYLERQGMRVNHLNRDGSESYGLRGSHGAILMVDSYTAVRKLVLPDGWIRPVWPDERGNVDWTQDAGETGRR
ncbi:hypothetical protein EV383_4340 [Pseudonocardia sediminis]|uniref:Uncharacterized protein n=1 Tax=Pseudonocardia sediminis TaxID=1397368 RepID=A0A4Q7UZ44_PSEST|nr:hypothetical protein [Pseudonocardia sediminis]RZT87417.1 hypothetical protein EV383_4340 [Pseudonocardia sediminis]